MEQKTITIKDREILVQQLNDAQVALMVRELNRARKPGTPAQEALSSMGRVMDLFEAAVVGQEDKDYLTDLTIAGQLRMSDLIPVLSTFYDEGTDEAKPVVRRGRPKRS